MLLRRIGTAVVLFAVPLLAVAWAAQPAAASSAQHVHIVNSGATCTSLFCFQPHKVVTTSGTTVVWKNVSSSIHTVTRCTVSACGVSGGTGADHGPNSPTLAAGAKYKFTFHGKGTYVY